jgi:hypothetical protein
MNDDGQGRRVFDGLMSHVAGAGKVFANHRFGMPGRTATQHEDRLYPENWFPFGNAVTTDPFSRKTSAILQGRPTDPLVIEINSATEYWQKGASLVHIERRDHDCRHRAAAPRIRKGQFGLRGHAGGTTGRISCRDRTRGRRPQQWQRHQPRPSTRWLGRRRRPAIAPLPAMSWPSGQRHFGETILMRCMEAKSWIGALS